MNNTLTNAITAAKDMIKLFCEVNKIDLNKEILEMPVKGINEFFEGRDQSGNNLSLEEVIDDLDGSEAMVFVDDITQKPVVIYDDKKLNALAFDDQTQIFIHEHLHFYEAIDAFNSEGLCEYGDPAAEEAEDELISILIFFYPDIEIEEGLADFVNRINPKVLMDSYEDRAVARCMLKQLNTIGRCEVLKRLQVR